jgi:hypothetical protein
MNMAYFHGNNTTLGNCVVKAETVHISILLRQHVSVLLDHLQASIQRYEVQSVHITYYGIAYYLQGVYKNSLKL